LFNPYINGIREIIAVIIERTNKALKTLSFFKEINESNKITTVSMAVISGVKFAYPNGIRLKYENVSLTLSVGDGAKVQTAPSGNASNTIVKAGKTTKLIFFMLCTSVYKSEFVERFPEFSLFYRLFSPLDSEMICIFPYFYPCEESARELREIFI